MLIVVILNCRTECRYVDCRCADCRYADCRYADCHCTKHNTIPFDPKIKIFDHPFLTI